MTDCAFNPRRARFLCLHFPYWATDRHKRGNPSKDRQAPSGALVLYEKTQNALRLYAIDERAKAEGLHPGQALAEARAISPSLVAAPADRESEETDFRALCSALTRYSPFVGKFGAADAFLDITGGAHLFRGEAALIDDACARLARLGLSARAGIADSPGAAFAAAHYGRERIFPPGSARDALKDLPVAALRLEEKSAETLRRLGLKRIGQLYDLPRGPLTARLGVGLLRRLSQALSEEDEPITPLFPPSDYEAIAPVTEPIASAEAILVCLEKMTRELEALLERDDKGGRRFTLFLYRVDSRVARISVGAARPERKPAALMRLFKDRLADVHDERDAGFGYDLLKLSAFDCAPFEEISHATFDAPAQEGDFPALLARLANRMGRTGVRAPFLENAHMPERSVTLVPYGDLPRRAEAANAIAYEQEKRPVSLLLYPEAIEAIASVPDGPPIRFIWRRVPYAIKKASGPERIAGDWRREMEEKTRDYYRVEDERGRRFWLYREGFFGDADPPQWYLHGFFG